MQDERLNDYRYILSYPFPLFLFSTFYIMTVDNNFISLNVFTILYTRTFLSLDYIHLYSKGVSGLRSQFLSLDVE